MFSIFDTAAGVPAGRVKTSADRACDQCKWRKVRCNMSNPCQTCIDRGFDCTYERARKKRGPIGRRISSIKRQQSANSTTSSLSQPTPTGPSTNGSHPFTPDGSAVDVTRNGASPVTSTSAQFAAIQTRDHTSPNGSFNTPSPSSTMNSLEPWQTNDTNAPYNQASPQLVIPSLPIVAPSDSMDLFGSIPQQELAPIQENLDHWPQRINEATLLPWIDVYFHRLQPTVPLLNRATLYRDMLLRRHHTDPQYGAMLLSLGAFAMLQPVQIHEVSSTPSRIVQATILLDECVKMRVASDFGEHPTIPMVLTSFFLFACLFASNQHRAARHRLREAVDLAHTLGLHLPQVYDNLDNETRDQWLRTYLVLSVTERAYALQKRHWISFRGSPAINARFMQTFDLNVGYDVLQQRDDKSDVIGMTGLLYLMATFDAIDESIIECWNGFCKFSDGACEAFDRRRALHMFKAQHRTRESCLAGTATFDLSATPLKLSQLLESQQADITVTQFWLLNRLWNLCLSHGLLRDMSDHPELRFEFACHIAKSLVTACSELSLSALEVHGLGMMDKVFDVAWSVCEAVNSSSHITLDLQLGETDTDPLPSNDAYKSNPTIRFVLQCLENLFKSFRGGNHEYAARFASRLDALPGYRELGIVQ